MLSRYKKQPVYEVTLRKGMMQRLAHYLRLTHLYVKRYHTALLISSGFSLLVVGLPIAVSVVAFDWIPPPFFSFALGAWVGMGYTKLYGWTQPPPFQSLNALATAFFKTLIWPLVLIREGREGEAVRLLRFFGLTLLFFVAAAFARSGPAVDELPSFQRTVYDLWFPFVFLLGIVSIMIPTLFRVGATQLDRYPNRLFTLVVSYLLFIGAFKRFADDAGAFAQYLAAHPVESLSVALILWAFSFVYRAVSRIIQLGRAQLDQTIGSPLGTVTLTPLITERDERVTSVHEAGHVLAYLLAEPKGSLSTVLEGVSASIRPDLTSLGRVRNNRTEVHRLRTEGELEWLMLRALAGRAAELTLLGESYAGSQSDVANWSHWASIYLSNGFGEAFYGDPEDEVQRRYNASIFRRLREGQIAYLQAFFERNRDTLDALAHTLQEEKELSSRAIQAFFSSRDIEGEGGGDRI